MDNYTKIPNDILEALPLYDFSPLEWAVIMYVIRKTFGWHKNVDTISVRKMAADTGHDLRGMQRAVTKLKEKNVLSMNSRGSRGMPVMGINSPSMWAEPTVKQPTVKQPTVKQPEVKQSEVYGQTTVGSDGQMTTHKRNKHTKDTNTKESFSPTGSDARATAWAESDLTLPDEVFENDDLWT